MKWSKCPVSILILSCLYLAVGGVGFVYHFPHHWPLHQDDIWIELIEFLAVVAGAFMLQGQNWARWLALAWIAFHVAISFPALNRVVVHTVFLALFAWLLFRPDARRYFARPVSLAVDRRN
jgi:hypothetical protein